MGNLAGIKWTVVCAIIAVAITACAPVPAPEAMTVRAEATPEVLVDRTLLLQDVLGGRKSADPMLPTLGVNEFKQALLNSLKSSRLFREVSTAEPADWRLKTIIISEQLRGTFTNIEELMVRYEIIDAKTGSTLMSEAVFTSNEKGVGEIFSGRERHQVLIEITARDNIAEFIKRLKIRLTETPDLEMQN